MDVQAIDNQKGEGFAVLDIYISTNVSGRARQGICHVPNALGGLTYHSSFRWDTQLLALRVIFNQINCMARISESKQPYLTMR